MTEHIIIYGAGAIGSLFGGLLAAKYPVTLIGRKYHVTAIKEKGLVLSGVVKKRIATNLSADTKVRRIPEKTLLLLTVKAHETKKAIRQLQKLLHDDTTILCIQNGLGSEDIVKRYTSSKVLRAITHIGAEWEGPGKIRINSLNKTYIEKDGEEIATLFSDAGLPTVVPEDFRKHLWEKLIINCVLNGLGTILGVRNNKLVSASLDPVKKQIVTECIAVAAKEGVKVDPNILKAIDGFLPKSVNMNSTLQDLQRHKRTEIDFLNGAVVRLGKKYHVPTPVNEAVCSIIHFLEEKR